MSVLRTLLVAVALGTASPLNALAQPGAPSQNGRFQIFFSPITRADTFLVDTQTGRTWRLTQYVDVKGEPSAWMYVDRLDDAREVIQFAHLYGMRNPTPAGNRSEHGFVPFHGKLDEPEKTPSN